MELLKQANGNSVRSHEEQQRMIRDAARHYGNFLQALGFDWEADANSQNTPLRVAKAYVHDLVRGTMTSKPKITDFPSLGYDGMVFQGNIDVVSLCSHHNLAFVGKAHCAYIPKKEGKVIGLSKFNRIVDWYARRPQIQEGLTMQIHEELSSLIENNGVMVMIESSHSCVRCRGIGQESTMITAQPSGWFLDNKDGCKDEFYKFVDRLKK